MIVFNHRYYNALFFDTLQRYTLNISAQTDNVWEYFNLKNINQDLIEENARLNLMLTAKQKQIDKLIEKNLKAKDTLVSQNYELVVAKVVRQTTHKNKNYVTINKGSIHGLEVGMGVISASGLVGRVVLVSSHYATVISLLHIDMSVSASIRRNGVVGSLQWYPNSTLKAKLLHVPSHLSISVGDTVQTSGYNAVFPPDIPIGIVEKVGQKYDETFYDVDIKLSTHFHQLSYVYVIKNLLQKEQEELEKQTTEKIEGKKKNE